MIDHQIITAEEVGFIEATPEPKYHHYDIYGRYSYSSDVASDRCTEVRPAALSPEYNWNDVTWICVPDLMLQPIGQLPPLQKSN